MSRTLRAPTFKTAALLRGPPLGRKRHLWRRALDSRIGAKAALYDFHEEHRQESRAALATKRRRNPLFQRTFLRIQRCRSGDERGDEIKCMGKSLGLDDDRPLLNSLAFCSGIEHLQRLGASVSSPSCPACRRFPAKAALRYVL
jgi:hypothetical protein